jgi:hypothetical protein
VLLAGLPLGQQLLGRLGLAFLPGQARLLVHPGAVKPVRAVGACRRALSGG